MSNPRIPFRMRTEAPRLPAFQGKTILVQLVMNLEHWRFDHGMPRGISTSPHGKVSIPDVPNFAWAEYGMRVGLPRMFDAIEKRGLTASCSMNANVVEVYESCAQKVRDLGWEFIGHGMYQQSVNSEPDEFAVIRDSLQKLSDFAGTKIRGWLGPGLSESADTPDYLSQLGIEYLLDWVLDDHPCWVNSEPKPLISVPYNLELNDSVLYAMWNLPTGAFLSRLTQTLETFDAEPETAPKVLSLGLHPHLMGVPHRAGEFNAMLDLLTAHPDVVFVQPHQTMDWFAEAVPQDVDEAARRVTA